MLLEGFSRQGKAVVGCGNASEWSSCSFDLYLKWHVDIDRPTYATPLITDLYSDGRKDIVVPTFERSIEVLEGATGARAPDFSGSHSSTVHTSPVEYDVDGDGILDLIVATSGGEILFFKDNGESAQPRWRIPRLKVRRTWYEGLGADPIDHSHPDVGVAEKLGHVGASGSRRRLMQAREEEVSLDLSNAREREALLRRQLERDAALASGGEGGAFSEQAVEAQDVLFGEQGSEEAGEGDGTDELLRPEARRRGLVEGGEADWSRVGTDGKEVLDDDELMFRSEAFKGYEDMVWDGAEEEDEAVGGDGSRYGEDATGDAEDARLAEEAADWLVDEEWADDEWLHDASPGSPYVLVDAHVLASPAVGDVDGDGRDELVLAVTYYFDRREYASEERLREAGLSAEEVPRFLASGAVALDMGTGKVKWSQHLDLSTSDAPYTAHAYAAPVLVRSPDGRGLDVVLGTSMGFLYVLGGARGDARRGWPLQMGPITAPALVADLDGDGTAEVVACDALGSVAAFRLSGAQELWERHLGSVASGGLVLGNLGLDRPSAGEPHLSVVAATLSGEIHALDARTGASLPRFPFRTLGSVHAAPLLTAAAGPPRRGQRAAAGAQERGVDALGGADAAGGAAKRGDGRGGSSLRPSPAPGTQFQTRNAGLQSAADRSERALQIVVAANDGYLYVVDPRRGCAESLDLGERVFARPLADDLDGDGRMELLVAGVAGGVSAVGTRAPYHPAKAWTSDLQNLRNSGGLARWGWTHAVATGAARAPRDVRGDAFVVRTFVSVGAGGRRGLSAGGRRTNVTSGALAPDELLVRASLTNVQLSALPLRPGERSPVLGSQVVKRGGGLVQLQVPSPRMRTTATVLIEAEDALGIVYRDQFALSFHAHFYKLLKWMVALPVVLTAAVVLSL